MVDRNDDEVKQGEDSVQPDDVSYLSGEEIWKNIPPEAKERLRKLNKWIEESRKKTPIPYGT